MIIGKSLTALGGGGLKPEIIVAAKAGGLLNLRYKDSAIILQSYQLGADETSHVFTVNISETAYVVEDVLNNGAYVEVLVNATAQYNVKIEYKLWLYKDGNEYTATTGGWITQGSNGSLTKNSDHMVLTYLYQLYGAKTQNTSIPNSGYNTLHALVRSTVGGGNAYIGFYPNDKSGLYLQLSATSSYTEVTLDVSSVSQVPFYLMVYGQYYNMYTGSIYIKQIWLE